MHDPEKTFAPELIDQQVEQPDTRLPHGEARLVRELQAMYDLEKSAAIDRVWERLAHNSSAASPRPESLSRQQRRQEPVRSFPMQQIERTTKPERRLAHTLSLIAAALICAVLVGSLALLLVAQRNATTPGTGSPPSILTAQAHTATPTPAIPAQCQDTTFRSDETLCATGQETTLNITKTFGSQSVTFVRAYADSNQLMLVYKIPDPSSDAISFTSITIQQGLVIGDRPGEAGAGGCFSNSTGNYCLEEFSMQRVPAGTTEIHVQAITDGFSATSTPFSFTIPFHTAHKSVPVNQTATSQGVPLVLERLDFTGSTLTVVFSIKSSDPSLQSPFVDFISINGQQVPNNSGSSSPHGETLDLALLQSSGAWEIRIAALKTDSQHPQKVPARLVWTFNFTVSK
jgi:hypothetical protein